MEVIVFIIPLVGLIGTIAYIVCLALMDKPHKAIDDYNRRSGDSRLNGKGL
jgi:hypothetical protein